MMPATYEQDGRIFVLEPQNVRIQSPEGQRYLRERHAAVMKHIELYPTLRRYLFTDKWADRFQRQWLADTGTLASVCYPCFYLDPAQLNLGIYPKDYLHRADDGLRFIVQHARAANRTDLIGNLLGGASPSAEFEVMLGWALSSHFGCEHVEPYPRIASNEKRTVDFAILSDGKRLLIEAMVLFDKQSLAQHTQNCIEQGIPGILMIRDEETDGLRLLQACHEKVHQRGLREPLFLCVNQRAAWPDPATGAEVVGRLLAQEIRAQSSTFAGAAYFYSSRLVASGFAEARALSIGAESALLGQLRLALCRLCEP